MRPGWKSHCFVTERPSHMYSRIISTKYPSFCTTAISASLTNLTARLLTAETYVSPFRPYVPHVQPVIFHDLITVLIFVEEYRSCHSSVCRFLQYPATLSLWASVIFSTLFSNPISVCSSVSVTDKASQSFNAMVKAIKYLLYGEESFLRS
jgi:hypothetical protein